MKLVASFLLIALASHAAFATLYPDKGKTAKQAKFQVLKGPVDANVFDRNLVEQEPLARDILINSGTYYKDITLKNFNGTVLGYVTAWNSHGYDVAKVFAKKFNVISPVWFQIVKNAGQYELAGKHDIDSGWVRDVRKKGNSIKFFPRMMFDKFTERDFSRLLSLEAERRNVNDLIVDECLKNNFDGIVLEFWSHLAGRVDDHFLLTLVLDMTKTLQKHNLRLILVIPPYRGKTMDIFNAKHFDELYKDVYAFSLMTYDYSNVQRPGANAPLDWMRTAVEHIAPANSPDIKTKRRKILMGLNMYGNDYTPDGGGPILGNQFLDLVKHVKKRLVFDQKDVENYFEVRTDSGRHYVFYPSLYSINQRIKLAQELGVGLSIWELGQGLDYFYDLF